MHHSRHNKGPQLVRSGNFKLNIDFPTNIYSDLAAEPYWLWGYIDLSLMEPGDAVEIALIVKLGQKALIEHKYPAKKLHSEVINERLEGVQSEPVHYIPPMLVTGNVALRFTQLSGTPKEFFPMIYRGLPDGGAPPLL